MVPEIRIENNSVQLYLSGSIYVQEANIIREKLLKHKKNGQNNFVIHMDQVNYIDSSGLGVLVAINKHASQEGGKVIIKGLKGQVKELFELTRLNRVFEIQD